MIITKTHQIKQLENHIKKLELEINRKETICLNQFNAINLLTRKIENQRREINNLHKWIKKK